MKQFMLAFTIFCLSLPTQSQTTFFKWIPSEFHESVTGSVQTLNGDFILVGEKGNNPDTVHGYCVKVNNNGDVVQTLDVNSGNRISRLSTINPYPGYSHRFIVTGGNDSLNSIPFSSSLILIVINDSLEIIQSKEIEMEPGRRIIPWKTVIVEDSIIYILARYDTIVNQGDFMVLKLNIQLSIVNFYHHPTNYPMNVPQDIFFNKNNETLYVYHFGPVINGRASTNSLLCLDRNLNYRYGTEAEYNIVTNISATPLNDSVIYVSGSAHTDHNLNRRAIGLYLVNDSNRTLQASEF
jgi:hypothetical protein